MSHLTTSATSAHRAQIVAEAVVSAYLNDITPTTRRHDRARNRHDCADTSPRTVRSPLTARRHVLALAAVDDGYVGAEPRCHSARRLPLPNGFSLELLGRAPFVLGNHRAGIRHGVGRSPAHGPPSASVTSTVCARRRRDKHRPRRGVSRMRTRRRTDQRVASLCSYAMLRSTSASGADTPVRDRR